MCHLETIIAKKYTFPEVSLGHGAYMISSNGGRLYLIIQDSWSSTESASNSVEKAFSFVYNDTIYCTFDPVDTTITFRKA